METNPEMYLHAVLMAIAVFDEIIDTGFLGLCCRPNKQEEGTSRTQATDKQVRKRMTLQIWLCRVRF